MARNNVDWVEKAVGEVAHEIGMAALGMQQFEVVAGLILVGLRVFLLFLVQKALRLVVLVGKSRVLR